MPRLLRRYTLVLGVGGLILMLAVLALDRRWIDQPVSALVLLVSILAL
jgi:alpha-beta hydrolase superfamily lysophospholipase